MRIIAGEFRGRRLLDPADQATRPVTDRVKQSLFDVLTPRLDETAVVYDVFAGTGSFGLEALSRGAGPCVFFERHRPALERLKQNIQTLGVNERCRLMTGDVFRLSPAEWRQLPTAEVIFFDPPYPFLKERRDDLEVLMASLASRLAPEGVISFRHSAKSDPPMARGLLEVDHRDYGSMTVRLLARSET